jgi:outer membrane protein assembly factor BamA
MKKFSFALAVVLLAWWQPQAAAQTPPYVETIPCPSEPSVGRPVLKLRAPKPDTQIAPQAQPDTSTTQPCNTIPNTTGSELATVEIRIDGLINVSESDVRKRMREQRLVPKSVAEADGVAKAESGIRQILFDYGYRRALASSRIEQHDPERPVLVFLVNEGPRFILSEIHFEGNHVFPSELLVSKAKECVSGFHKDDPSWFDPEALDYCLHDLANFERSQGYLRARFSEPAIDEVGTGLMITVHADEGVLYRLGRLEIEGADHVAEPEVRTMLDMQTGDIANGEKLAKTFYESLKAIYGEKGFIQYTAEIQPEFHTDVRAGEGVVDIKVTIDEGRRFKIRKIRFTGDNPPESELRQLLLLREGDVYNQKLFEQSVKRINETGLFNWVDKDRDVDFRTNEEEYLLDLVIKVVRRQDALRSDP